ncbi:MAG: hypothetical protein HYW62_02100 [Candidatus Levybacteria bacterium]|nr:hypothetical protein [Candidatus Levybacteria bacterium]
MIRIWIVAFLLIFFLANRVYAKSDYVLPYPSNMPGGLSYKLHLLYENISKYWYFGDFGQFDYNLKMADKYLVEAKTLFDYKQYLLGFNALQKTDSYSTNILPHLIKAEKNSKDVAQKKMLLKEAMQKHIEVLEEMKNRFPATFIWEPEKSAPTILNLEEAFNKSIQLREKIL